jgi:hypothetical protein
MNSVSETVQNVSGDKIEAAPQEQKPELNAELVELGKVSDTRGGWLGWKEDMGVGFQSY